MFFFNLYYYYIMCRYLTVVKENLALREDNNLLLENGKSLDAFMSLPHQSPTIPIDEDNYLIAQEKNYDIVHLTAGANRLVVLLNHEQRGIYDQIMHTFERSLSGFFFVYGYGGTGKTLLWNALICSLRSVGEIVIH